MPPFNRYAEAHVAPSGPGDARPTAQQIIADEHLTGALADKTILITGCSSGLGIETARALAATGARLFVTVRNEAKGRAALQDILGGKDSRVELILMNQSSLESVRRAANEFLDKSAGLNVLINNAGIASPPYGTTEDGFETQFGVNHLSHLLLFQLLKPALLASSTASFPSRVVNVSSLAHRWGSVHFGDYNLAETGYEPLKGYAQSKTCNIWMANEIERRYGAKNLHGLSLHPGGIMTALFDSHEESVKERIVKMMENEELRKVMKNAAQGSATIVLAAVGSAFHGRGGLFLEDCTESFPVPDDALPWGMGYAPWAFDTEGQQRLWGDSLGFLNLPDDDLAA